MFHLPKQVIRPSKKSPMNKNSLNRTDPKRQPNITQIKQEIQSILKRSNSPLYIKTNLQTQKSQKYLDYQSLQRKKSKPSILKVFELSVQMAKNNRKHYQEYLFGANVTNTIIKKRTSNLMKQNIKTIYVKSIENDNDPMSRQSEFITSKTAFDSHRTIGHTENARKSRSLFHNDKKQKIGLGKLLFSTDNQVKFRRTNLLSMNNNSNKIESKNISKQTLNNNNLNTHNNNSNNDTLYQKPQFDITKYIKPEVRTSLQMESKETVYPSSSTRQRSFEILKKQIIYKKSRMPSELIKKTSQLPKIIQRPSQMEISDNERNVQNDNDYHHQQLQPNTQNMNKTLNVIDDQLIVYYEKLNMKKLNSNNQSGQKRKSQIYFNKINNNNQQQQLLLYNNKLMNLMQQQSANPKATTKRSKQKNKVQSSWRTHRLDPWDKLKNDSEIGQENLFDQLENKLRQERFSEQIFL